MSDAVSGESGSEAISGDGADYRGRQQYSRFGKKCLVWETQDGRSAYRAAPNRSTPQLSSVVLARLHISWDIRLGSLKWEVDQEVRMRSDPKSGEEIGDETC